MRYDKKPSPKSPLVVKLADSERVELEKDREKYEDGGVSANVGKG